MGQIKITCKCGGTMELRGGNFGGAVSIQNFICDKCQDKEESLIERLTKLKLRLDTVS